MSSAFSRGLPRLGQGTWYMGEGEVPPEQEADALRLGLDLGMTLIDTAEMYGNGGAERVVGRAIAGRRDGVLLVSKVLPANASRASLPKACAASLKRLGTNWIDLYLLHWRGRTPLSETAEAFERLRDAGHIRAWGVSNFDVEDMAALPPGCAANQILYNLENRGPEFDLLPWLQQHAMAAMAYSPLGQARGLLQHRTLAEIAARHNIGAKPATPAQVALAFTLARRGVCAIPKASTAAHVRENAAAEMLRLGADDLAALDRAFPPPRRKVPLAML